MSLRPALLATTCGMAFLVILPPAWASCEPGQQAARDGGTQVLTLEEAAAFLRLDDARLAAAAARGEVPGRRILGAWRFSRAGLIAWLAGADRPAECFEGEIATAAPHMPAIEPGAGQEPSSGADLSPRDMANVTGTGPAGGRGPALAQAQVPAPRPAAEAPDDQQAGEEPGRFGEEPELETARELALREEAVLGRRGLFQLEAELSFARQETPAGIVPGLGPVEQEQETSTVALFTRYALSDRFQLEAGGALSHRSSDLNSQTVRFGGQPDDTTFGDVSLGSSYQLLREETTLPGVFLSGNGIIPTDGSETFGLGGSLALTKRFDPTTLFGSVGYLHTFNANDRGLAPDDRVTTTLGFVFAMNDRLAFRMALGGTFLPNSEARDIDLRSDERFDLSFSLPTVLSENFSLDPSVSFGLDDGPGRFSLGLSLVSNFSVPRLF